MLTVTPYWSKRHRAAAPSQFYFSESSQPLFFESYIRMDASDKLRRDQGKTAWIYYSTVTLAGQGACNTGCGATLASTCTTRYTTFGERYIIATGRQANSTCTPSTFCL